ncbi:unnamed protein product [Ectocarpus sp. 6 AP-2014]
MASPAVASTASAGCEQGRRRKPRVVFHVTGFGVFNGVADNPTTHLVNDLQGELEARRRGGGDCKGGQLIGKTGQAGGSEPPALDGDDGEEDFEVSSCTVLHVSAEVGGRQLRELHAASSASSRGGGGREAVLNGDPAATADGGTRGLGNASVAAADGCGGGSGEGGKSADEGGGPGCENTKQGHATTGGNATAVNGDNDEKEGKDNEDDDSVATVFVHCGVNGGSKRFALETRGFNEATFRVPDEQGYRPSFAPVEQDNPFTGHCRVTTVPVTDVLARLERSGWGREYVEESKDAGRFVCNYVYYSSLGLCERSGERAPAAAPGKGGAEEVAGPSGEGGEVKDAFCFSGDSVSEVAAGAATGSGEHRSLDSGNGAKDAFCFSGDGGCEVAARTAGAPPAPSGRHSLFIHVPPFEAIPKEKQLALLVACLSAIASSLASPPPPVPRESGGNNGLLGSTPSVAPAAASSPPPPLSLSTYEAAVLAAGPEACSPDPPAPLPSPDNAAKSSSGGGVESAVPPSSPGRASSIRERTAREQGSERQGGVALENGGGNMGREKLVQFALDGLADNQAEGGMENRGGMEDKIYPEGTGGHGGSGEGQAGELNDDDDEEEEEEGQEEGETVADATRRRLIEAGFDGLDVDAAMATTGSDNTDVNMEFLLDITPLLPRGAPSDAGGLYPGEFATNEPATGRPAGGSGGVGANGDRGRGETTSHHRRRGSGSWGANRSKGRGGVSPAGMGGVSPKWIGDVSPARDGVDRVPSGSGGSTKSSSGGGGGLLSRLRRGHRKPPSAASAASEVTAEDDAGERSSEQRALSSSSSSASSRLVPSSFATSPPPQPNRRAAAHVIRSHSPPPMRSIGAGNGFRDEQKRRGSGSRASAFSAAAGWGETSLSGPNLTLALLVRLDLGMSPGTLAAQCAKAALAAARKAEGSGRSDTLAVWREAGESMIVLGAEDAANLDAILVFGASSHLPITMVRDKQAAWVGNVRADTCTVAAIGPAPISSLRTIAGGLRVL